MLRCSWSAKRPHQLIYPRSNPMRTLRAIVAAWSLACLLAGVELAAQEKAVAPRFDIESKLDVYPQDTPEKTLKSVVQALEKGEYAYVLAHLADPGFVDAMLKQNKLSFKEFVQEVKQTAKENPEQLREMRKFDLEGEWTVTDTTATARAKSLPGRAIIMLKIGDRWFMSNERTAPGKGKSNP